MRLKSTLFIAITILLTACSTAPTEPARPSKAIPYVDIPMTPVSLGCLSHDGAPSISSFRVQEFYSKRMVGGLSCGGIAAFGYMLPLQWQPGMKVKVRWKPNARDWMEKITTIKRYKKPGTLYVHFFQNDEVRVVSSPLAAPESPYHPILNNATIAPPEEE
ncbi:DUF3304 domain-containing protein [Glaciimonas sp. GNP009]